MNVIKHKHSGFVIEAGGRRLGVDLGDLMTRDEMAVLGPLDAILVSHRHGDHFKPANILTTGAPVALPSDVADQLPAGVETHILRANETLRLAGFEITPGLADHGPRLNVPIENYSLLVRHAGHCLFYTGDAAAFTPPPPGPFDVVLIPVDGSGFVFSAVQAAEFIRAIGHRGFVVPVHDGDGDEAGHARQFAELVAEICIPVLLSPGDRLELPA